MGIESEGEKKNALHHGETRSAVTTYSTLWENRRRKEENERAEEERGSRGSRGSRNGVEEMKGTHPRVSWETLLMVTVMRIIVHAHTMTRRKRSVHNTYWKQKSIAELQQWSTIFWPRCVPGRTRGHTICSWIRLARCLRFFFFFVFRLFVL